MTDPNTTTLKRIATLTSGGDAPGMNACIRAIVRTAAAHGLEVLGYKRGYRGILENQSVLLDSRSVSNILQRGGTILGSARCKEFETPEGVLRAAERLREDGVDALLVIGGDGSLHGARDLMEVWDGRIIGLPGTIDNDLGGTDWTIGFYTALETALDAIDKIKDTAEAFDRVFLLEVMGRNAGFIAVGTGIAGGAEEILIPEEPFNLADVIQHIHEARKRGKGSYIIVVAEGACPGGATAVAEAIKHQGGIDSRVCILGHVQRGGSPCAIDRILASKLGSLAVDAALEGRTGVMVGTVDRRAAYTPFEQCWAERKPVDEYLLKVNDALTL